LAELGIQFGYGLEDTCYFYNGELIKKVYLAVSFGKVQLEYLDTCIS